MNAAPLFACTNKSRIVSLRDIVVMGGRSSRSRLKKQGGSRMSGAQMAHFLKQVGKGSELAGIGAVFRAGWIVGVGQTLLVGITVYGAYRLGRWGYEKIQEYYQEGGCIVASGDVV